jgi:hypothetical protein
MIKGEEVEDKTNSKFRVHICCHGALGKIYLQVTLVKEYLLGWQEFSVPVKEGSSRRKLAHIH